MVLNEDFGFPNSARLAIQPSSLLPKEEGTLMITAGALECIRSGTTTVVPQALATPQQPWRRRPALRVRGVRPRKGEWFWPGISGEAREGQSPQVLTKAARRGLKANR